MPATPRIRPSRILPDPLAPPSVPPIRPRAPRTKRSEAKPQIAATGIAKAVSSRAMPVVFRHKTMAAGTASSTGPPSTTASEARWLLLRIGPSNRGRGKRPADDTGHRDEREHIRERLKQDGVRAPVRNRSEPLCESARKPEEQRG